MTSHHLPQRRRTKKEKISNMCCWHSPWSMVKLLVTTPLAFSDNSGGRHQQVAGCGRTLDIHMNLLFQQVLQQHTTDNKVASNSRMVHRCLSRRSNPELFNSDILLLLKSRAIMQLGSVFQGLVYANSTLLHTTLLVLFSKDIPKPIYSSLLSHLTPPVNTHSCVPLYLHSLHWMFIQG